MITHGAGNRALDEFLPESAFTSDLLRLRGGTDLFVAPGDVRLDPIDAIVRSAARGDSPPVQMWPMLAAALVAIGVSMLAMAAFARFGLSPL